MYGRYASAIVALEINWIRAAAAGLHSGCSKFFHKRKALWLNV
jgi:hypothetical protein